MKIIKWILSLSMFLCLSSISTKSASIYELDENANAANSIVEFKSHMNKQRSSESIYAGAWIDEKDIPHISTTQQIVEKDLLTFADENKIELSIVKHSYHDLLTLKDTIFNIYNDLTIYTDESRNCLVIEYDDVNELETIKKNIEVLNRQNIEIKYEYSTDLLKANSYDGGSIVQYGPRQCAVGFVAKSSNTYGVVTAGHCWNVGAQTNLGNTTKRMLDPIDASFIETNNPLMPKQSVRGKTYKAVASIAVQGQILYMDTYQRSVSGKVLSTSINESYPDEDWGKISVTDAYKVDWPGRGGDSGALVLASGSVYGYTAVGIHTAGSSSFSIIVKADNIINKLGLTKP